MLKKKLKDCASRPLTEFNMYETLEMMEALQNTARDNQDPKEQYYRIAYQMARSKIDYPRSIFAPWFLDFWVIKTTRPCSKRSRKMKRAYPSPISSKIAHLTVAHFHEHHTVFEIQGAKILPYSVDFARNSDM